MTHYQNPFQYKLKCFVLIVKDRHSSELIFPCLTYTCHTYSNIQCHIIQFPSLPFSFSSLYPFLFLCFPMLLTLSLSIYDYSVLSISFSLALTNLCLPVSLSMSLPSPSLCLPLPPTVFFSVSVCLVFSLSVSFSPSPSLWSLSITLPCILLSLFPPLSLFLSLSLSFPHALCLSSHNKYCYSVTPVNLAFLVNHVMSWHVIGPCAPERTVRVLAV